MPNTQEILCSANVNKIENYWRAIRLYLFKPHTINRRLAGVDPVFIFKNVSNGNDFVEKLENHIRNTMLNTFEKESILNLFSEVGVIGLFEDVSRQSIYDFNTEHIEDNTLFIVVNKLLPKNLKCYECSFELAILGRSKNIVF